MATRQPMDSTASTILPLDMVQYADTIWSIPGFPHCIRAFHLQFDSAHGGRFRTQNMVQRADTIWSIPDFRHWISAFHLLLSYTRGGRFHVYIN